MIPKIIHGTDFQGLRDYLIEHRDHEVLALVEVSSIASAAQEMELTASYNCRVRSPVLHISMSAAIEDGTISKSRWLALVASIVKEFQLGGHQHVVVRHRDKAYDHIHVFFCKVSLATFKTPEKQLFLKKGSLREARGGYPLTVDEATLMPPEDVVRRSFDSFALFRLQDLCRLKEVEWELRSVRTHKEVAAARAAGEPRPRRHSDKRRQERTGATPLIERGSAMRTALDAPNWPEALERLRCLEVGLQPVFRKSQSGPGKLVGLCLYDSADRDNRMKASDLDVPGRRYGLRQIESRHEQGALTMEEWWDDRFATATSPFKVRSAPDSPRSRCQDAFDLLREATRADRAEKRRLRDALKKEQTKEVAQERRALMVRRKAEASELPASERRAFYGRFSRETSLPTLEALATRHRAAVAELRVPRQATWAEFIEQRALSGDPDARQVLAEMVPAPPVKVTATERSQRPRKSLSHDAGEQLATRAVNGPQPATPTAIREVPANPSEEVDIAVQLALLGERKDKSI
ncbi:MAG TPA: relaxase/mobilization nuclease domain-containing protein [Allosphingosinicella sp.]|jgi:hypothetical protein